MIVLETPWVAALNHLLGTQGWARERLAPHAGETVEFAAPPLPALRLCITPEGRTAPAPGGATPDLRVRLRPEALAALARGEDHFFRAIEVTGNEKLAAEILVLTRHLRWDAEEDLSRLTGDIVAHRVMGALHAFGAWQRDAVHRSADGLMEYATGEARLLVTRAAFERHATGVAGLRDALERFAQRLERAAAPAPAPGPSGVDGGPGG